jgi:hypothetical protein
MFKRNEGGIKDETPQERTDASTRDLKCKDKEALIKQVKFLTRFFIN